MELFVSNLPQTTTEAQILNIFAQYGIVHCSRIRTVSDVSKNNMKTFAYVQIPTAGLATEAIAKLDNSIFAGTCISVKQAK
ncbi:MAG: RNA-binding protein [Sphingobacteriales bacterium]|nr:MAG: RNA-binding protein [Sphingobacteriales bacterium]